MGSGQEVTGTSGKDKGELEVGFYGDGVLIELSDTEQTGEIGLSFILN